jgi:diguanylate cyclase (GGDEF)-like protein/PAS domain S-box-containing protein
VFLELVKGAALLLALSLLQSFSMRLWRDRDLSGQVAQGLLFGLICVIGMMTPLVLAPGVIFDARSVVLSLAALFGGPIVALVSAAVAGAYRIYLGGPGASVGVSVIGSSVALGLGYRWLVGRHRIKTDALQMLVFGMLVHAVVIFLFSLLPPSVAPKVIGEVALPILLVFPCATVLLGWLLQDAARREANELQLAANEARFRGLLQDIPTVAVQGYAPDGTTTYWNAASERLYGYSANEAVGRNLLELIIPQPMRQGVREAMQTMFATGEPIGAAELILQHKDGSEVPVFSSHALVRNGSNSGEMFCFDIDLAERKRAEAELRVAAISFEAQEGMLVTDANHLILKVNQTFSRITGYTAEEAIGRTPEFLKSGRHDREFYVHMVAELKRVGKWEGEIWNRHKNGEVCPEWMHITAVMDERGRVANYVTSFSDITQRKAAEDQIRQLAFFDPLTGLPNRRMLMDRLQHALASSARNGMSGALLFIDLDHFKTLNDTLGHDKGDLLLQQVAQRLLTCVREDDTVARLGGDEYVVMLESLNAGRSEAASHATLVGEKIINALNQPYRLAGIDFHSTPSVGIALYQGHQISIDELLRQADLAMYQAKNAGRNAMRFFDPQMQAAVTHKASLETDIRRGILRGEFLLHFQPQVDAQGRVIGAEALLRWEHPSNGMVSPAAFIPVAEETGQILALGSWVLETACLQLVEWAEVTDTESLVLAVNVSSRQFRQPDFAEYVLGLLDYTGANPKRLKLELTESLLAENLEDVIVKMSSLRERGVSFALDDFGTGYSSLSYLKRLPLDQLKIDQSFVQDVLVDANDAAIARTIVALGNSLGLAVIAEGVETTEQRDFLLANECRAYQGYLFSKPLPIAAFEVYVRAQ